MHLKKINDIELVGKETVLRITLSNGLIEVPRTELTETTLKNTLPMSSNIWC